MSTASRGRCHSAACAAAKLRQCYFCPNLARGEHATISASGVICNECSAREREKQEVAAREQQAAAKASGCLVATLVLVIVGAVARSGRHARL